MMLVLFPNQSKISWHRTLPPRLKNIFTIQETITMFSASNGGALLKLWSFMKAWSNRQVNWDDSWSYHWSTFLWCKTISLLLHCELRSLLYMGHFSSFLLLLFFTLSSHYVIEKWKNGTVLLSFYFFLLTLTFHTPQRRGVTLFKRQIYVTLYNVINY